MRKTISFLLLGLLILLLSTSLVFADDTVLLPEDAEHYGEGGISFNIENLDDFLKYGLQNNLRITLPYHGPVSDGSVSGYWDAYISGTKIYSSYTPDSGQWGQAYTICGGVPSYGSAVYSGQTSSSSCTLGSGNNGAYWSGWW